VTSLGNDQGRRAAASRLPDDDPVTWLITGGAGYIGAHVVHAMRASGFPVIVLDDLSTGSTTRIPGIPLVVGSVGDGALVRRTISDGGVTGVIHLAGKKQAAESISQPLTYYQHNVEGLRCLLEAAAGAGLTAFVFSSSAAVYGMPSADLVTEDTACHPQSPYGITKLVGEWMIRDTARATGMRYANLRYFNVAGAARPELADRNASNLIPVTIQRLRTGQSPRIFGDDYPTPDGTCIRDYIHVADVASAHVAAARAVSSGELQSLTANVGRGQGASVREVLRVIQRVSESGLDPVVDGRRPGDPARVVASASRIQRVLGWTARYGLDEMISSAWAAGLSEPPIIRGAGPSELRAPRL
jgi:UDP-glucose 4-epimerase